MPIVFFQEPFSKAPIGIPIPDVTPLNPPLGLVPPLPPKIEQPRRHRAHVAAVGADGRASPTPASTATRCSAPAGSTSARYGRLLKSRQLVGVRGAGLPFDGLYYVKSVTHDIERGEYKQSFSLARNALISTVPDGAGHERRRAAFYGKYRGTVVNNIDPLQIGRIQAMVPDVPGFVAVELGDAVRAGGRHQHGRVHGAADRRGRVDRVRARRSRLSRSGSAATGAARPRCRCSRRRCRPGVTGITLQTTLKNGIVISDVPGPTRRHPDPDHHRAR